jgi:putative molybdopterin biosynthesis protein
MSIYLQDIPLPQARDKFQAALAEHGLTGILGNEKIDLDIKAIGRVLSVPVWARISSPHYHAAAMDGFAVKAEETIGALPSKPISLVIGSQAVYVDTGDPIPEWANAVIPIEQIEPQTQTFRTDMDARSTTCIGIRTAITPWMHVRTMGEDIVASQLVLPAGQVLRPVDLGVIAASGERWIEVSRKPRVAVIPTGSELVEIGKEIKSGSIIEYNSLVLAGQIEQWGGAAVRFPIVSDDKEQIKNIVKRAAEEFDLVLINAGSSAGSEDFTASVVAELGKLLVHGVAVRPGHPVILGIIANQSRNKWVPVIGIPGYPVSAALTGEIFVEPLIAQWTGRQPFKPQEIRAYLTKKVTSPAGDDDYLRVAVGEIDGKFMAAPLTRGAGVISSLVKADGISIIERGKQGLEAGSQITVRLYRPITELSSTILAIGSHDISLDILSQHLSKYNRRLVSANVGSLGGLLAIKRGEAHLAGSHLLDPETGDYNTTYIQKYLPGEPVRLMVWLYRLQGLIVKKGNPKNIHSLADLTQSGLTYVNRQRGSGTRILLDYQATKLGIKMENVQGYDNEEYTHLGVGVAVASGRADCGLGIAAAADALDLDFVELFEERYDLVIPIRFLDNDFLDPIFDLAQNQQFRTEISQLAGYDTKEMGKIIDDIH